MNLVVQGKVRWLAVEEILTEIVSTHIQLTDHCLIEFDGYVHNSTQVHICYKMSAEITKKPEDFLLGGICNDGFILFCELRGENLLFALPDVLKDFG